ncbi:MAG: ComEA family DNA-binding protein [Parashewanella sp.]
MKGIILASLFAVTIFSTPLTANATEHNSVRKASSLQTVKKSMMVNVNTADISELQLLRGIGVSKAKAILEHRKQFGKFRSKDDLLKVKGIGNRIIESNKANISF